MTANQRLKPQRGISKTASHGCFYEVVLVLEAQGQRLRKEQTTGGISLAASWEDRPRRSASRGRSCRHLC